LKNSRSGPVYDTEDQKTLSISCNIANNKEFCASLERGGTIKSNVANIVFKISKLNMKIPLEIHAKFHFYNLAIFFF
jgi:hypothetical protein